MRIGVIGFQGAITEHIRATKQAMQEMEITGDALWLKNESQLTKIDGLIIPGGESTTIGNLMLSAGVFENVKEKGRDGFPIFGTCAGLILLADRGGEKVEEKNQPLLELMNVKVERNAFGRQKESFETELRIPVLGNKPFHGVFIRAPAISEVGEKVNPLVKYNDKIVAAEQENLLSMAFHPELTSDTRSHEYFLEKVQKYS